MRWIWPLPALLLLSLPAAQAQDTKDKSQADSGAMAALDALRKEVQESAKPFVEKYRQAKTDAEKAAIKEEFNNQAAPYAVKFLALAEKFPKDPAAFDALVQTIVMGRAKEAAAIDKAVNLLLTNFADDERAQGIYSGIASGDGPGVEKFLRTAFEKGGKADIQGPAAFGLARHFKGRFETASAAKSPQAEALGKEAEKFFQLVVDKYADVRSEGEPLGESAKTELFELRFLAIGRIAPETQGQDTDGKSFKLSDYKGKVIVLDFWAST